MNNSKIVAIILSGGSGKRLGWDKPKQFIKIAGKTILEHTLSVFDSIKNIDQIIIVSHPDYINLTEHLVWKSELSKPVNIIKGGRTRQESSYLGLRACPDDTKYVLIHDVVRPFVTSEIISKVINGLKKYPAVDVAIPSADTIIEMDDKGKFISSIPNRSKLKRGQTPQGFWYDRILKAHTKAIAEGYTSATDDCSLIMKYNLGKVYVVDGEVTNIKITYMMDVYLADELFRLKSLNLRLEEYNESIVKKYLRNKVVVIFGHTSGIGRSIYDELNHLGICVHGFSRSTGIDITSKNDVSNALRVVKETEGKIDYVINTAGVLYRSQFSKMPINQIMEMINVNYIGTVLVAKESIPYLKETKGGLILFGSSAYTRGRASTVIYSSTKSAVVNFVQGIADELAPYNIKVNVICPERTKTPMRERAFGKEDPSTLLDPKDVAKITILLMTKNVSGQIISVRRQVLGK